MLKQVQHYAVFTALTQRYAVACLDRNGEALNEVNL